MCLFGDFRRIAEGRDLGGFVERVGRQIGVLLCCVVDLHPYRDH